jgi:hypothetical protein
MAEYFRDLEDAAKFMNEWFAKDGKLPRHFAKILNHGVEKWIVNYDAGQEPRASRYIKILEDHSGEIRRIVRTPWPELQLELKVAGIKQRRKEAGTCLMCGGTRGVLDKLFRRPQHTNCQDFRD